jgi:hypothetical protein
MSIHESQVTPELAMIPVHARPHPMSMEVVHAEFKAGSSIAEILGPEAKCCRVEIGGMTIPEEWWIHVRPRPGVAVVITRYPAGGDGFKNVFRIIAFAALAVGVGLITAGAGSAFFASLAAHVGITATFAAGSISAGLLGAGLGVLGSLAINALIPPSNPTANGANSESTNLLKSITGTSNQINRYGVIPCVVGTVRYYPPYAALPYTELSGDDQYLRCLFDLGYGDPDPSDMKIGDTDLANYTDVETEVSTSPTLFSQDIAETTAGDALNADGSTATRTSSLAADELSIDWANGSGLFGVDTNGKDVSVTQTVKVEYSPIGAGSWTSVDNTTLGVTVSNPAAQLGNDGLIRVVNGERKAVRVGLRWKVTSGQYDIRFTRVSTNWGASDPTAQVGDLTWTVIRTIRYSAVSTTGTKKIALRIKATDQLSGNIDQFNCIVSQPISVWHPDTGSWVTQISNNPAYVYRWLMRECPANPRKVVNVDDDAIKAWAVECDEKEFCYSNTFDQPTTLFAMLKEVAAAGRASFNIRNGLYGVVRDVMQSVPVQMFTPRNSSGFGGNRAFPDQVHALRVQFINEEANFQQDERIVYDDGYGDSEMVAGNPSLVLATNFEQMTLSGCTNADAAWRLGRYHMAVSRLRQNTYSWNADVENLVCSRGDLVGFANDVIGAGLAQGRVKQITLIDPGDDLSPVIQIVLDEKMTLTSGTQYGVRIRKSNGGVVLTAVTPDAYGVETSVLNLTTPPSGVLEGDLVLFGTLNNDSIPLVITKIEPSADLSAKITAVDAAFAVLNADAGDPPAWTSQITGQPWLDAPNPPDFLMESGQLLGNPNDAGNTAPVIVVTIYTKPGLQSVARYEIRWRRADIVGAWTTIAVAPGDQGQITGIQRGLSYQVEARAVGTNGAASVWVQQTHLVSNASQLPIAPTSLAALSVADGVHLNWSVLGTQRSDVEYSIERTGDSGGLPDGAHWANIANIKATAYTDGVTDGVVRWYRVRAVDFQGLTSAYTNNVNSNNKSVANGADKTSEQALAYTGISNNLVPNGDFILGNLDGWNVAGAYFSSGNGGLVLPSGGHAFSPTFAVQRGNKYRITIRGAVAVDGTRAIYHRIFWGNAYAPNITDQPVPGYLGYLDFLAGGNMNNDWTIYTYDWLCPDDGNNASFATLALYQLGTAIPVFSHVGAQDYSAAAQWGADITGLNTSNNTNNVSTTPASTVAGVIPDGKTLFLNAGSRAYSFRGSP